MLDPFTQQKAWLDGCHAAIPDLHLTLNQRVAEDDLVVVHFTFDGTQKTEWRGFAPTGQRLTTHGMALGRLADGMIVEDDIVFK
jgi:predicted ester cyclase